MMRCRNVAELITSDRLKDAGFWLRMQVRLHLWMCRYCARLARQVEQLRAAAGRLARSFEAEAAGAAGDEMEARLLKKISERRE